MQDTVRNSASKGLDLSHFILYIFLTLQNRTVVNKQVNFRFEVQLPAPPENIKCDPGSASNGQSSITDDKMQSVYKILTTAVFRSYNTFWPDFAIVLSGKP